MPAQLLDYDVLLTHNTTAPPPGGFEVMEWVEGFERVR